MTLRAVDPEYRHAPKVAAAGTALDLGNSHLKWYDLAPADKPVPEAIAADARDYLCRLHADGSLDLADDRGFVILHRCGESFYFLLVSIWRGANELWEAVYYRDATMDGFATFDPAYPAAGLRPTFCVWELGIVAHESTAWSRFLSSPRAASDDAAWRDSQLNGLV